MAYFKPKQQKINGLWYPQSQTLEQLPMSKIVERLTQISTVSKSDVQAVLGDLAKVLDEYMDLGYSVKLDGLGSFYYTAVASKNGVATEKEVSAAQIVGTRVRFIPEYSRTSSNATTRALAGASVTWKPFPKADAATTTDSGSSDDSSTGDGGSSDSGDSNPL